METLFTILQASACGMFGTSLALSSALGLINALRRGTLPAYARDAAQSCVVLHIIHSAATAIGVM
jgi:hypothetical protein